MNAWCPQTSAVETHHRGLCSLKQLGSFGRLPRNRRPHNFNINSRPLKQAAILADGTPAADDPVAVVAGDEVVPFIRNTWAALSKKAPETVTIVSPFWAEGTTASEALFQLSQEFGSAANLELVCRGEKSADGETWLPVFDSCLAIELKNRLSSRLFLRATLPDVGLADTSASEDDIGDELEEKEFATRLGVKNETRPRRNVPCTPR